MPPFRYISGLKHLHAILFHHAHVPKKQLMQNVGGHSSSLVSVTQF